MHFSLPWPRLWNCFVHAYMYRHAFFTPFVCEQVSLYHSVGPVRARDYSLAEHCLTVLINIQYSRASTRFSPVLVLCSVFWFALCKAVLSFQIHSCWQLLPLCVFTIVTFLH